MLLYFIGSKVIAYVDKELLPAPSIRHEVLLPAGTEQQKCCKACRCYRNTFRSLLFRSRRAVPKAGRILHHHTNDWYLSTPKQKAKVKMQRVALKEEQRRVRKLKLRVEKLSKEGVVVDCDSHEDLLAIMKENSEKVAAKYPENSFARLFWSQQLKAAQQKTSKSMRWHPVMVRWCIYLRHISGKGTTYSEILGAFHFPHREHYVITHTTTKHAQDFLLVQMKSLFGF